TWLMSVAPPALVGTYAFVNPVVAVLLGWLIGGEVVSHHTGLAAACVVAGVVLITLGNRKPSKTGD
ncbi:MAG: EamA family transporter, partial [Fimbriiglobus sp.]